MPVKSIQCLSALSECNPENDKIDIHVTLDDDREFTLVLATLTNIFGCMENEGIDYYFGEPIVFVKC